MRLVPLATIVLFLGILQATCQDAQSTPHEQQKQSQSDRQNPSPSNLKSGEKTAQAKSQEIPEVSKPWYKTPEWIAVCLTGIAVCLTAIYVIVSYLMLNQIACQSKIAKQAADAATLNADALIHAERAWVMIDLEHVPGYGVPSETTEQDGSESINIAVRLICRNDGKTPAWIITKMAAMRIVEHIPRHEDMPPSMKGPIHGDFIEVCTEPLSVGKSSQCDFTLTCKGRHELGKSLMIFGEVEYRDVFAPNRTTSFGYSVTPDNRLTRIAGIERYGTYNRNT